MSDFTLAGLIAQSGTGFDRIGRDFDILRQALADTGLTKALNNADADLTLFAPDDRAFLALARSLGFDGDGEQAAYRFLGETLDDLSGPDRTGTDVLRDVLLTHVVGERLSRADIAERTTLTPLLEGASLAPFQNRLGDADPDLRDAAIVPAGSDIRATNGTLQTINRVLLPLDVPQAEAAPGRGTIASFVQRSDGFDANRNDFDILAAAVDAAGLGAALDDAEAQLTLFAPTDAAFIALARDLGLKADGAGAGLEQQALETIAGALADGIGKGDDALTLSDLLLTHVLGAQRSVTQLRAAETFETLEGATLKLQRARLIDGDTDSSDPNIILPRSNRLFDNGAIQVIDGVLLPREFSEISTQADTVADVIARQAGAFDANRRDFDVLQQALEAADLVDALANADATLTLLAPTDGAFLRLGQAFGYKGDEAGVLEAIGNALEGTDTTLSDVLLTHVVGDSLTTGRILGNTDGLETLSGTTLQVFGRTLIDGDDSLADPRLSLSVGNQRAGNGIVQVIDNVLLPADLPEQTGSGQRGSILDIAQAVSGQPGFDRNTRDFDMLLAAADAAGLAPVLDGDDALTLFAPTDGAFLSLAHDLGFQGRNEGDALTFILEALEGLSNQTSAVEVLTEVLEYHVLGGLRSVRQLLAADQIETVQGGALQVTRAGIIDAEPDRDDAQLVTGRLNIRADNGAIQVIDEVLLPLDLAAFG